MWTLKINKDRHKFSSSHFTIFSESEAEALHGHNYYIGLEVKGNKLDDQELLIDVVVLKKKLTELLEAWDEKVLLPKNSPFLQINQIDDSIHVKYSNRKYSFPKNEVEVLDVKNVTMESLAKLISDSLSAKIKGFSYTVSVKESQGQEATFTREAEA
jgi:6-pyruvoyltetrahydropterin/6-carboxytetrahydropterin synthase